MLRQEINLYRCYQFSQPATSILSWKNFCLINLILFCFFSFFYLFLLWDIHSLHSKKIILLEETTDLHKKFAAIKSQYPSLFFSSDINQTIQSLEESIALHKKTLEAIKNLNPFSNYFIALSQGIVPAVWLTNIFISKGGNEMALKGKGLEMENLKYFIDRLSRTTLFSGFSFTLKNIERTEEDSKKKEISFEIVIAKQSP